MVDYRHNKDFGNFGEAWVIDLLRGLGLLADYGGVGDILVGGISIEVKIARPSLHTVGRNLRYQFCLWRNGHTEFRSDYLVLLCSPDSQHVTDVYVIPGKCVDHKHKLVVSCSDYTGKWSKFCDAWENILCDERIEAHD